MKLTFRTKLFLPLLISWLCLLGISAVDIVHGKNNRLEERQLALKFAAGVGLSTVKEYADLAAGGALTREEA
jgi:methyl-accepting chemotaxis protein